MTEALKNAGIVNDQEIIESLQRSADREQVLREAKQRVEEADLLVDVAKAAKKAADREAIDTASRAESFIAQGVRVDYWDDVLATYIRKAVEADSALGDARALRDRAMKRLRAI